MPDKKAYLPLLLVALVGLLAIAGILHRSGGITGLAVRTITPEQARPQTLSFRPPCNESDRGYDWYLAGTTWYGDSTSYTSYHPKSDSCIRANVLREYYCYNNRRVSRTVTCPTGYRCAEGACMPDGKTRYTIRNPNQQERPIYEERWQEDGIITIPAT